MSEYNFEKQKLYSLLPKHVIENLKTCNAIIAGGTITSLFCNREINDIDIYFRTKEDCVTFMDLSLVDSVVLSYTDKAILYMEANSNIEYQIIMYDMFNNVDSIFKAFDFTVCMGAFDFLTEEFILHPDFLKHNAQRILKFNKNTAFPLISALRIQKYKEKGYTISKLDFTRILLSCMMLDITCSDDLKAQLGGMYGYALEDLIEDDADFSINNVIDKLEAIVEVDNYFENTKLEKLLYPDEEWVYSAITKFYGLENFEYILKDNNFFVIYANGRNTYSIDKEEMPKNPKKIWEYNEHLKKHYKKLYKFVELREDGTLHSFAKPDFIYKVGETVVAKSSSTYDGTIYCGNFCNRRDFTYREYEKSVMLEIEVEDTNDLIASTGYSWSLPSVIGIKKGKVLRVVPENERMLKIRKCLNLIKGK